MEHFEERTKSIPAGARNETDHRASRGSPRKISSLYVIGFLLLAMAAVGFIWHIIIPILGSEGVPTRTSETFIVWRRASETSIFSPRPSARGVPLHFRRPLAGSAFEPRAALDGDVASGEFIDDRGRPIVGVAWQMEAPGDSQARMVDRDEALAAYRRQAAWEWLVGTLCVLLLGSVVVVRRQHAAARGLEERVRQQGLLRENDFRYRVLFESAGDGIFLSRGDHFVDCNQRGLELFGCGREQLIEKSPFVLSPPRQPDGSDSREGALARIRLAMEGQTLNFEWQHRRWDGTLFDADVTLNRVEIAGEVHLLGLVRDVTKHKRAQNELRRSHEERQSMLASIPDYLWSANIDRQGRVTYLYYSPVVEKITGRPPEFYMQGPDRWLSTVHPDDRARLQKAAETISTGQLPQLAEEYRIILPDGTVRWVHDSVQVRRQDGTTRIDGVVSDITERKGAEEAGRESEERYRRLFEVESDAILLLEPDTGRILDANAAALELYGYTRKEFLLLNIFEVSAEPEKTRKVFAERRVRVPLRWHRKKDGTVFPVEIVGNSFLDQGRTNHVAAIRDITERKGGEMALREAELMLRFFVQHAPAAIAMLDREMRYLVVSRRWMTDFQTGDREILGLSHYDVFPEIPEHWKEIHQRCLAGSVENCEEEPFPRLDGRIDWVRWEVRPWRRIDNSIGGIIIFSELITERKRVDAELQRSFDQLRALAAWLQSVREEERKRVAREIHDQLGQALTAIKIELSSLVHELPVGDKPPAKRTSSILQLVDESIRTVRRISTELRPGMLDDLGLVATIEWAGEDFQARTGTTCRLDLPRDDIAVDPEQATAIFRIFQETLTNVARHADATAVEVRLVKEGGELMLKVHDNGKGIPEGKLSASKSLGILGMRERAILLGGELAISSLPGAGTTVRVRIPGAHRAQREQGHG